MYGDYNGEWGFTPSEQAPTYPYAGRRTSSTPSEITYDPSIRCGDCNGPASSHPIKYVCYRDSLEVGNVYAERYEDEEEGHKTPHDRQNDLPITQSGMATPADRRADRWAIEPEVSDGSAGKYDDLAPSEHTVTLAEYRSGKRSNVSIQPERRNVYLEGLDGFLSINVYDERLTSLYAARLLNVFIDKNTKRLRVGSIEIVPLPDGTIDARCVNSKAGCDGSLIESGPHKGKSKGRLNIDPNKADRNSMEDFVLDVIRHGNNHVASFIKDRKVDTTDKRGYESTVFDSFRSLNDNDFIEFVQSLIDNNFEFLPSRKKPQSTPVVKEGSEYLSEWHEIGYSLPRQELDLSILLSLNSKELQVA